MEDSVLAELMRKITRYYDHQMSQKDEKLFLTEIVNHPAGFAAFNKEKAIREKIKSNLHRPQESSRLADQIKDQIKKYPH